MQNRTLPYFLILPSLLLAAVVIFWPVVHLFEIATHDVNRFGQLREFNDGANFTALFATAEFMNALWRTAVWTVAVVGGALVLSIPVAIILNMDFYGRSVARVIIMLPWAVLSPLIVLTLFPFAVMFLTAVKPAQEVLSPNWWPSTFRWQNFSEMWVATNFGNALLNSIYVSVITSVGAIIISIPAAYAMSRFRFAAHGAFRQFLLVSQMISPIVLVLGLFRLLAAYGLIESVSAVGAVYMAFNIAFTVWMLQSYFDTIPRDLEEAAWMEGAGRGKTLVKVFLPLCLPAIAVTAIFTFINAWNEFVVALTMLRRQESYTLPIQVFSLVAGRYTVEWHYVMAATFLATLPVAILFIWLQRYLIKGLALGAVK